MKGRMRRMKRTRKLLAMFMMFIMVMGEMGSAVFAAGIDAEPDSLILSAEAADQLSEPAEALADVTAETADAQTENVSEAIEDEIADVEENILTDAEDADVITGPDGAGAEVMVNGINLSLDVNAGKYYGSDGVKYDSAPSGKGYIMYDKAKSVLTMKDYTL